MSISRTKSLVATQFALVAALFAILYFAIESRIEKGIFDENRDAIIEKAILASAIADRSSVDKRNAYDVVAEVANATGYRVSIISSSGVVLADSFIPSGELKSTENHGDRPEVIEALERGSGFSSRYSQTVQSQMLYAAKTFKLITGSTAIIRLSTPLATAEKITSQAKLFLVAIFGSTFLLLVIFGTIAIRSSASEISKLAGLAKRLGAGDTSARIEIKRDGDISTLGTTLNEMAERIQLQLRELESGRQRLQSILSNIGEGIIVTDHEMNITLANPAFCELFSISCDVVGGSLIEVVRHPELDEAMLATIRSGSRQRIELQVGSRILLVDTAPLVISGIVSGVVAAVQDITYIKDSERMRKDFVANVSHELRTPVSVIKGYCETLLSGIIESDTGKCRDFVSVIDRHTDRLASLVSDLLTLSKLESQVEPEAPVAVTLKEAFDVALAVIGPKAEKKAIKLDFTGLGGYSVIADRSMLEQVFVNLIDNAVKYSNDGGIVTVCADATDEFVTVQTIDRGIGIPAKDIPKIFERFYRVDTARSREEGGTGLGLSIVKHIILGLGGSVSVKSDYGAGSTFSFTLKRYQPNLPVM